MIADQSAGKRREDGFFAWKYIAMKSNIMMKAFYLDIRHPEYAGPMIQSSNKKLSSC
jgi:hypothetical protein